MKHNKILLMSLIIFTLTTTIFVGTVLGGIHDCDCDGECDSSDDCCGCSTGSHSVFCDECESDEECSYGSALIDEDGVSYAAACVDKC